MRGTQKLDPKKWVPVLEKIMLKEDVRNN